MIDSRSLDRPDPTDRDGTGGKFFKHDAGRRASTRLSMLAVAVHIVSIDASSCFELDACICGVRPADATEVMIHACAGLSRRTRHLILEEGIDVLMVSDPVSFGRTGEQGASVGQMTKTNFRWNRARLLISK
jgi:hypothetical protein